MELWLSSKRATFWIKVEGDKIVDAAPIARKYIGRTQQELIRDYKIDNVKILNL